MNTPTNAVSHTRQNAGSKTLQRLENAVRYPHLFPLWLSWNSQGGSTKDPALRMFGMRFSGFPHFNAFVGASHYRPRRDELSLFDNYVTGARTIFDVGANFGIMACLYAKRAPDARIFAFEPHPSTYATLKGNLERNGISNVSTHQLAVGSEKGTVSFTDHGSPASNRISDDTGLYPTIDVPITTLDMFVEEQGIDEIDFLKIDVEGAELKVLQGLSKTLGQRRVRAGMIELCPGTIARFGASVDGLLDTLAGYGYSAFEIDENGHPGAPISRGITDPSILINAVFLPQQD